MKTSTVLFSLLISTFLVNSYLSRAQDLKPEDFGYRHLTTLYQMDTVHILILSKKGEEQKVKPVLLFGLDSLPKPLIILKDDKKAFGVFPFMTDSLLADFHLAGVGKPSIPLIAYQRELKNNAYIDPITGISPAGFYQKDYVDYYVDQNIEVIRFLKELPWVSNEKFIIAGHSASSTVMAKLATKSKDITHLIYSGGNPFGRMITMIAQSRSNENPEKPYTESYFEYWEKVVNDHSNTTSQGGDSNKTTYDFSLPPIDYLREVKVPALVTYGTKDHAALFNDFLRLEMIKEKKGNFTFKPYVGLEHNFFGFNKNGEVDFSQFGWDEVVHDWKEWINNN